MDHFYLKAIQVFTYYLVDVTTDIIQKDPVEWMDIYSFPQTWGSSSLGFKGNRGASLTKAQTTVVRIKKGVNMALIFFGRKPAYLCDWTDPKFQRDLKNLNMKGMMKAEETYKNYRSVE